MEQTNSGKLTAEMVRLTLAETDRNDTITEHDYLLIAGVGAWAKDNPSVSHVIMQTMLACVQSRKSPMEEIGNSILASVVLGVRAGMILARNLQREEMFND